MQEKITAAISEKAYDNILFPFIRNMFGEEAASRLSNPRHRNDDLPESVKIVRHDCLDGIGDIRSDFPLIF